MEMVWLAIGGSCFFFLVVLSFVRYRELPLLVLLALQPLKQYLLVHVALFRSVDPTLLVTIWLAFVVVISLPRAKPLLEGLPLMLYICQFVLAGWVLMSLMWTSAPQYGAYKGLRFAFLNTAIMVAPFATLLDRQALQRLTAGTVAIASVVYAKIAVYPSYEVSPFSDDKFFRAGFLYGNDAATYSHGLAGALCLAAIFGARRWWVRVLAMVALPALMCGAWLTGTRASVTTILVSAPIVIMMSKQPNKWLKGFVLLVALVLVLVLAYLIAPSAQQYRIMHGLTDPTSDESGTARFEHWGRALRAFAANPLGAGIGSYAVFGTGQDTRWFPHSIILEALAELGILGGALLVSLFALFFVFVIRVRRWLGRLNVPSRFFADAWLVATIAAMVLSLMADDLADNRAIWMAMGVCVVAYLHCLLEASEDQALYLAQEQHPQWACQER